MNAPANTIDYMKLRTVQIERWIIIMLSFWLSAGYLLPNTFVERLSARYVLDTCFFKFSPTCWMFCVISLVGVTLFSYARICKDGRDKLVYFVLLVIYSCEYAFALIRSYTSGVIDRADILLVPFTVGLITARVLSRATALSAVLILGASVQCLYCISLMRSEGVHFVSGTVHRIGGTFGDPTSLYLIFVFTIPLAFALAVKTPSRFTKCIWLFHTALLSVCLILTFYRGGIIAAYLSGLYIIYRACLNRKQVLLYAAVGLLIVTIVMVVRVQGRTNERSSNRSVASRIHFWKDGFGLFLRHPLFGVGVENVWLSYNNDPSENGSNSNPFFEKSYRHPYNALLFFMDQMGLVGGLLYVSFLVFATRILCSAPRSGFGVAACWLGLMTVGMFDVNFGSPNFGYESGNMLFGCLIGMTGLINCRDDQACTKSTPVASGPGETTLEIL